MLADEVRMSSISQGQLAAFKQAIEHEHNIKIYFVSGGTLLRDDTTYVRRGCYASSRLFHNYGQTIHWSWCELPANEENCELRASHIALERLGDLLSKIDNLAW